MAPSQPGRSLSSVIARFAHQLRFDQLPQPVIDSARRHLLDTVGCCLAAKDLDSSRALAGYLGLVPRMGFLRLAHVARCRIAGQREVANTKLHRYDNCFVQRGQNSYTPRDTAGI